jgi:tetratricopeptide (TPR) repeat protein
MESAEVDLVDESPDPTNEVAKVAEAELARPARMPSGTLTPPVGVAEQSSDVAFEHLAATYRRQREWATLVEVLLERSELLEDIDEQRALLHEVAEVYERELDDQESAFYVLQAAFNRDRSHEHTRNELERLATAANLWHELDADVTPAPPEPAPDMSDPVQAIAVYHKQLERDPGNLVALHELEALYEQTAQYDKYLGVLQAQLELATGNGERIALYERIATAHEERFGDLARAAVAYEHIIDLDPRNYAAYHLLARLYQQAGNHEGFVETHRRHAASTSDIPTQIELYVAMGQAYTMRLRDIDRAIEAYNDALALDPREPAALDALAALYEQLGEWDHAVRMLGRVVEISDDKRKAELFWRMGRIQANPLGDAGAAEANLSRVLALAPDHVPAMQMLIAQYSDRGDWQKAAQMMTRAETHAPVAVDKVRLLCDAANIYLYKLRDADKARELYAKAIALDPEHVETGRSLADLYFQAGDWKPLLPVLDMLCRKADQLGADPKQLHDLHDRAARCADELGDHAKALGYYNLASHYDPTDVATLLGRADLLFKLEDWDSAGKAYTNVLVQQREGAQTARIHQRLGVVLKQLGHRKKALAMFAKALELDPRDRDTLLAMIDLHTQLGDWEAVVRTKRALADISDDREKTKLLEEVGALYHTRLQNPHKAAATYVEALEVAPDAHQLLQKLLDLCIDHKQWTKAVETIERFVALESDPFKKGLYFHAAGTLCRDELKSADEAVDYYDCALDSFFAEPDKLDEQALSRALMSFQAIDAILTTQRDWKAQERAYRDMLKRLGDHARFHKLRVGLLDALGEIYRSRLKQYAEASQVFELAQQMDPDNSIRQHPTDRAEILAELYVVAGADHADKAVEQHTRMLRSEPFKYDSYKALAQIYRDTNQYDKYWCLSSTLTFLKRADADEHAFFEQYRPRGLVKARLAMTPDTWTKLAHPDENRYTSAIFGACWQGVAAMHAFPHKDFGVKREDRRQLHTDSLMFSKLFVYVAQTLNVQLPDVYLLADNKAAELQLANAIEKSELCPSFVVRPHLLQGKTEREVAFLAARRLTYMRPEYYLRMLLPTNTELKVALLSAIVMVQPQFPVPPNLVATIQQYLPKMQKRMPAHALEQLGLLAQRFIQATPEIDMAKWGHAVDAAAHRAGFVSCGDLGVAARSVAAEPVVVGGPTVKHKVKELVLFSISPEYFAIRAQMGLTIAG